MQDRVKYNTKIPFSSLVPVSGSSSGDHRSPHALAPQPLVGLKILDFYITTTYSNYAGYYFALSRLLSGVCVFALSLSMFLVLSPTQTMTSHFRHQSNAALVRICLLLWSCYHFLYITSWPRRKTVHLLGGGELLKASLSVHGKNKSSYLLEKGSIRPQ